MPKEVIMMLLPSIFAENLFDDWFDFPTMRNVDRVLYGKNAAHAMKTDVKEQDDHYEVDIDLPGFKKDQISLHLENGYLTVCAEKSLQKDEKDANEKIIRQERYAGAMQRSFYVDGSVTEDDISARFEDGVLKLSILKKDARKLPEKKTILIEG